MATSFSQEESGHVERDSAEEATGAPLTPVEEESSARPPGVPRGMPFGSRAAEGETEVSDGERERLKELNPDDFE
ncbi:hypothetical protein [Sphaerisporangium dianthi]|uniref:Uncharacterized protein n=1 Tax=Sphaerisporangium dianthi TaxID=1436120 RepID=A0ABV9CDV3_9ACTN